MNQKRFIDTINFSENRGEPDSSWDFFGNILSKVFGDIISDDELLEKCYSKVRSRKFDEEFVASISTGIPGAIFCSPELQSNPSKFIVDWIKKFNKKDPNPSIIIGDVGTGKSTFINYQYRVYLRTNGLSNYYYGLIIDLGNFESNISEIKSRIYDEIENECKKYFPELSTLTIEDLLEVYKDQLTFDIPIFKRLKEIDEKTAEIKLQEKLLEINKNSRIKTESIVKYIHNKYPEKTITIILDNVDHHPKSVQEEIFFFSKSILHDFRCPLIMTARKYTVPKLHRHISLAAFQPRFLALSSPSLKDIIFKRSDFIFKNSEVLKQLYDVSNGKEIKLESNDIKWSVSVDELKSRLDILLKSLMTDELLELLNSLFDYDIRTIMKAIKTSLSSGFLYEEKSNKNYITIHDFLRSITLGNNPYYEPNDSLILNLFCNEKKNSHGNNLIRLRLLQTINYLGLEVSTNKVIEFMISIGYNEHHIKELIERYLSIGLIESPKDEGIAVDDVSLLTLTKSGRYYLDNLISNPRYLQYLITSSYIDDNDYSYISSTIKKKDVQNPKERINAIYMATDRFVQFILNKEKEEKDNIELSGNSDGLINISKLESINILISKYYQNKRIILDSL